MISFLKNIFNSTNQKNKLKDVNDNMTRIYFDRYKRKFLEIKIPREFTCQDIHCHYHNDILAELMKNNSTSGSNSSFNKIINQNEFAFMIIDDENLYTEIKLKMKDTPCKYLKKKCISLYYLNVSPVKKEESSMDVRMNNEIPGMDNYSINTANSVSSSQSINQGECIREGELMKYSFKHKKFDKRIVVLDKEKLIITKPKNKESTILLLSDISLINREISDKSAKDKFTFEITTFESDHYIFRAKHNADMESWMDSICNYFCLIRDNKFIIKYGEHIKKLVKDTYEKGMKIIYNCLSLKGLVSIKETRELLFKMYGEKTICSLLEAVINYKHNLRNYKYLEAWTNFEDLFLILDLDNFDINTYFQPIVGGIAFALGNVNQNCKGNIDDDIYFNGDSSRCTTESFATEQDEIIKNLGNKSSPYNNYSSTSCSNLRKGSNPENKIKQRKVLLENTNKVSSREKETILRKDSNSKSFKNDMDEEKTEQNNTSTLLIKDNSALIEEREEFNITSLITRQDRKLDLKGKLNSTQGIIKVSCLLSNASTSPNTNTNFDSANRNKTMLIKHLISFENLKYLKTLKLELKELIEKYKNENNTNEFNAKLYDSLKSNIFNELFDNILTKYLQNFYKTINTNPNFTSRIENILLYYYRIKNKINANSLINLENNNFSSPLSVHKPSNSMSDMKLSNSDDKNINKHNYNSNDNENE